MVVDLVYELLVILGAGFIAGAVAKRLGFSMLVGYLVAGAVIGHGGLGLVGEDFTWIDRLARAGALLLLLAIGIEFSLEDLLRLSRYFILGGSAQMALVAVPVAVGGMLLGSSWQSALLIAAATALSSTVLVFRGLTEWGETASPAGRRAIGILLFQDVALVPLMLLVPLLTGGEQGGPSAYLLLAANSILFVATVPVLRWMFRHWLVPLLGNLRSVELVILFALIVMVGFCLAAYLAGLPPALGAFAAGLVLNGNRLTKQIDALILPYRESFGAIFFVSLGTLLDIRPLMERPALMILGLLGILLVKAGGAAAALRITGLSWKAAAGMGLGLAQLGELSFVLLTESLAAGLISQPDYNQMLFVAIATVILTPQLLKLGLRWAHTPISEHEIDPSHRPPLPLPPEAIIIGLGPIGRQAASRLEIMGIDVCLVDLSPVNLHEYAQQGFRTLSGDAREPEVLHRADAAHARLAIICVPDDRAAGQIVKTLSEMNPSCAIVVRCRYQSNAAVLRKAGARAVVSEEVEASAALLRLLESMPPASAPAGDRKRNNPGG